MVSSSLSMLIPLTTNKEVFVTIDDEDLVFIKTHTPYLCMSTTPGGGVRFHSVILKKTVFLSRLLMNQSYGSRTDVDHINRNTLDNRKSNLRVVDTSTNNRNRKRLIGSSKFRCVTWNKEKRKWAVLVQINKKPVYGGRFNDEMEAAIKADDLMIEAGHDLWNLNFPILYGT